MDLSRAQVASTIDRANHREDKRRNSPVRLPERKKKRKALVRGAGRVLYDEIVRSAGEKRAFEDAAMPFYRNARQAYPWIRD
jgi:hypothetical protein